MLTDQFIPLLRFWDTADWYGAVLYNQPFVLFPKQKHEPQDFHCQCVSQCVHKWQQRYEKHGLSMR